MRIALAQSNSTVGDLAGNVDLMVRMATRACAEYLLDWLWTGDDVASQQGMMMSPAMYAGYSRRNRIARTNMSTGPMTQF